MKPCYLTLLTQLGQRVSFGLDIVWQVFEQKLDWFRMHEREYVPLPMDEDGVIRSQVFPGLWLAANDLLAGSMGRVLAVLLRRVSCTEHTAFVEQLAK